MPPICTYLGTEPVTLRFAWWGPTNWATMVVSVSPGRFLKDRSPWTRYMQELTNRINLCGVREGNRRSKAMTQWQVGGAEVRGWEKRPKMKGVGFVKSFVSRAKMINSTHSVHAVFPCMWTLDFMRETVVPSKACIRPKGFGFILKLIKQIILSIFCGTKDSHCWLSSYSAFKLKEISNLKTSYRQFKSQR